MRRLSQANVFRRFSIFFSSYGSGKTFLQGEGHPCHLHRDNDGAGECDDGLVCYDVNDPASRRGLGECVRLSRRAAAFGMCDADFGVDACESGYTCRSESRSVSAVGRGRSRRSNVSVVRTGTCMEVRTRAFRDDTCDASLGRSACDDGFYCLGSNGVDLGGRGYGVCTAIAMRVRSGNVCDVGYGEQSCGRGYYCSPGGLGRRMEVVGPDRRLEEVTFKSAFAPAEAVPAPVEAVPAEEESARDLQQINAGGQCSINLPCQGNDAGMCCSKWGYCGTGYDCECPLLFPPSRRRHPVIVSLNVAPLSTFQSAARAASRARASPATAATAAAARVPA